MKAFFLLTMTVMFILTSCNEDTMNNSINLSDFSGLYTGTFDCTGGLSENNGDSFSITIQKKTGSEIDYSILFEDEVNFDATVSENVLLIPKQIFNIEEDFDQVSMEGEFIKLEDGNLSFDFDTSVDEELASQCSTILIKQ